MKNKYSKENLSYSNFVALGASDGCTTGSAFRVIDRKRPCDNGFAYMCDRGLFQGIRDETDSKGRSRNAWSNKVYTRNVQAIILSHAHIDHSGALPKNITEGLDVPIYMTPDTAPFVEALLRNSAHIQKNNRRVTKPMYSEQDVDNTVKMFRTVAPGKEFRLGRGNTNTWATFVENGHAVGSVGALVTHSDGKRIFFSGDVGGPIQPLCGGYEEVVSRYPQQPIDTMVVGATGVEASPVTFSQKEAFLVDTLQETWKNGGKVLMPVLSFQRGQEMLEMIGQLLASGKIPKDVKIFLDGPLMIEILDLYKQHGAKFLTRRYGDDPHYYKTEQSSLDRFSIEKMQTINSHQDSVRLDLNLATSDEKALIIAGGGMGVGRTQNYTHGRFGKDPKNCILLSCFPVYGTEAEHLLNKGQAGDERQPGARVVRMIESSSHCRGPGELFGYLERFNLSQLGQVFVVHGNDRARRIVAEEFKNRGYGAKLTLPEIGQVYSL